MAFAGTSHVTTIAKGAFEDCYNLGGTISIPASVVTIANGAFRTVDTYQGNTKPTEAKRTLDLSKATGLQQIDAHAFSGNFVGDVVIPANLTTLGQDAFSNSHIERVTFAPNGKLKTIGGQAFVKCEDLTSVEIPNYVTSIGSEAFAYCTSLTNVDFSKATNLSSLGDDCFHGSNIENLSFATNGKLNILGKQAFYDCQNLKSVVIPSYVTTIDNQAFACCSALSNIDFSMASSLRVIGPNAFERAFAEGAELDLTTCSSLSTIERDAFKYSKLKSIDMHGLSSISGTFANTFYFCHNLVSVNLAGTSISTLYSTFDDCNLLENVVLPSTLLEITAMCFRNCTSLKEIDLPNGLQTIGVGAFEHAGLKYIIIPSTVQNIATDVDSTSTNAFDQCTDLHTVVILSHSIISQLSDKKQCGEIINNAYYVLFAEGWEDEVDPWWFTEEPYAWLPNPYDSVLDTYQIDKYATSLNLFENKETAPAYNIQGDVTVGNVILQYRPDTNDYIAVGAVPNAKDRKVDIVVPDDYQGVPVTAIADYAFVGYEPTNVYIGNNVETIGEFAFLCTNPRNDIYFGEKIGPGSIGFGAFLGVTAAPHVTNLELYQSKDLSLFGHLFRYGLSTGYIRIHYLASFGKGLDFFDGDHSTVYDNSAVSAWDRQWYSVLYDNRT